MGIGKQFINIVRGWSYTLTGALNKYPALIREIDPPCPVSQSSVALRPSCSRDKFEGAASRENVWLAFGLLAGECSCSVRHVWMAPRL